MKNVTPLDTPAQAHASLDENEETTPRKPLPSLLDDGGFVGESEAMRALGEMLGHVAGLETTVLIQGESGTGKELVARTLHLRSRRASAPFVAINCAALTEALLEGELFGHVRGAFTGATSDKQGLFEAASRGTLFLDELGELSPSLQAKLLRVLQERVIRPVGGAREKPVDVRVIAATNRDLEAEVRDGRFREDLYYRVNVFIVEVPPLRERGGDVFLLANHFLADLARRAGKNIHGIDPRATAALAPYPWPGNVRELHNCVERAVALAQGDLLALEDLPRAVLRTLEENAVEPRPFSAPAPERTEDVAAPAQNPGAALFSLEEMEERHIRYVLEAVSGNKSEAARILGIDRRTLHRKLKRMGLQENDD